MEESNKKPTGDACTFERPGGLLSLTDVVCDDSTPLLVALWTVYGAIVQAHNVDPYNEQIASLHVICKEAMERAKQIPPYETETGC